MFARSVSIRLKPNSVAEFTQLIEKETLPQLRKQKGFQDEMTFVVPGGAEAVGISLWDQKENADAYSRDAYPGVLKALRIVVLWLGSGSAEQTHSVFDGSWANTPTPRLRSVGPASIQGVAFAAPGSAR